MTTEDKRNKTSNRKELNVFRYAFQVSRDLSNISEKRSVLFDLAFWKVLFLLSSVVIFDFGAKFDYSFLQLFKFHGFLLLFFL